MTPEERDALLHDVWLAIVVQRFDHEGADGPRNGPDSFYTGIHKAALTVLGMGSSEAAVMGAASAEGGPTL